MFREASSILLLLELFFNIMQGDYRHFLGGGFGGSFLCLFFCRIPTVCAQDPLAILGAIGGVGIAYFRISIVEFD